MKKIVRILCMGILSFFIVPFIANAQGLIESLEVDGIGALNISSKNTWNLSLTTTLDYATINATPANDTVKIEGTGKVPVTEGDNQLIVTATDGTTTETYTINLNMKRPSGDDTDGNPNTGAFVSTITLIIATAIAIVAFTISKKRRIFQI